MSSIRNYFDRSGHFFWLNISIMLTGTACLFWGGPDHNSPRAYSQAWDIGHIIYFALLTGLLSGQLFFSGLTLFRHWLIILSLTLFLGILIEVLQYGVGRNPDAGDVVRDLAGSILMLSFGSAHRKISGRRLKAGIRSTAVLLLLVLLWPLIKSLADEIITARQFPVLSNMETPFELDRWSGGENRSIENIPSISDSHILAIKLTTALYSGVGLKYFSGDWRGYKSLAIDLYHTGVEPLRITCRIHDLKHVKEGHEYKDRYNRVFILSPGWNKISIDLERVASAPEKRKMDMAKIRGVGIFTMSLARPQMLYLDNVRLSR